MAVLEQAMRMDVSVDAVLCTARVAGILGQWLNCIYFGIIICLFKGHDLWRICRLWLLVPEVVSSLKYYNI
jgi:hypothetical protein